MGLQDNGVYAEGRIEYNEPSTTVITIPNGDFATNDMTNWTQNAGTWLATSGYGYGTGSGTTKPKITSAAKIAIAAGNTYIFTARSAASETAPNDTNTTYAITLKIDVKFYTAGGSLISTVNIATRTASIYKTSPAGLGLYTITLGWGDTSSNFVTPATATQFEFVAYIDSMIPGGTQTLSVDDFTCVQLANSSALIFRDSGLFYDPASGAEAQIAMKQYQPTTKTVGITKTATNTTAFISQEQSIKLMRAMTLDAILWDLAAAGDYTLTIRNWEGNVLQTISVTGVATATLGVVFAAGGKTYLPGRYHLRMTKSVADGWYVFTPSADQLFTEFEIIDQALLGGILNATRAPLKLRYYEEIV
jgi:hypothetical protein